MTRRRLTPDQTSESGLLLWHTGSHKRSRCAAAPASQSNECVECQPREKNRVSLVAKHAELEAEATAPRYGDVVKRRIMSRDV